MGFFDDVIQPATESGIRALVIGYAQAAGLKVTNWRVGSVAQQLLETLVSTSYAFARAIPTILRGFSSLDTATDPGDVDPYDDENASLTPAPGFLSNLGENVYGTTRGAATFATGYVTFVNAGDVARVFSPYGLTFTWTEGTPPSPAPTYVNTPDASIYVNGFVRVDAGSSITIPVVAQVVGSVASAPSGTLSLTTTLLGCTATNAEPIIGSDREDAATYRARCRQAPSRLSFGGPSEAFLYFSTKDSAGDPLTNATGAEVNINRVQVTESSSNGHVNAYYAAPSGAAIAYDVLAANANIQLNAYAVPDAVTFTGTTATPIAVTVVGTAKVRAGAGVTSTAVKQGIVDALVAGFETIPIGGVDQNAGGAGVLYTADIEAIARGGFPGLYDVRVTTPAGASTAIPAGQVPTVTSTTSDWTVTIV